MKYVIGIILALIVSLVSGMTLDALWGWFIVPKFGLPTLGLVSAMGLSLIVHFLTFDLTVVRNEVKTLEDMLQVHVTRLVYCGLATITGYVLTLFM